MHRLKQTPRRISVYQEKEYIIPRLFLSVDLRIKQHNQVKVASTKIIEELTYLKRNNDYKATERSLGPPQIQDVGAEEIQKAYEVKVKIKFVKTKPKLQSLKNCEFEKDYKVVKFPFKKKQQTTDEIELSRKLNQLLSSSTK